ncbi:hypothetical protein BGW41_008060 [Actinomortierella wolfii]|nr:hypothetical protein BGW41_008060 [Actinomortierella wolfii]
MSNNKDDDYQRPRFPPPPTHFHGQQQQHFRPGQIPGRLPGQGPPPPYHLHNVNVNGQPFPPGAPPLAHQPFQGQRLPHPHLPPNHPLNTMHQHHQHHHHPGSPQPGIRQQPFPTGVNYHTAVHHQHMVFPPPTPRVRRESSGSNSSSSNPQSPTGPPPRTLPPIPAGSDAKQSRDNDNEDSSSSVPSSKEKPPSPSISSTQRRIDTLNEETKEPSKSKSMDRGIAIAAEISSTASLAATAVNTGIIASKAMNNSKGESSSDDDTEKNPVLAELVQMADKLVDLGKVTPFIAPAFVLLKTVDMTVKQVIERMHVVLKESAALIQAYRKQSKLARRLKISNNQNFAEMAARVATVTEDLMFSLQIQQAGDLSILKRSIPLDDEDKEAKQFVEKHGGQKVVENDPKLVEEFAKKMHLAMSDQVMEQMQSDLGDMLKNNQNRIEELLKENSREAVAEMIRAMAKTARGQAEEKTRTCVQCEKEYLPSSNGPEACTFHLASPDRSGYSCCGKTSPCQVNYHRTEMHCDYPFPAFFDYARAIVGYTDTVEYWGDIEVKNMLTNETQIAAVGLLLRWRSRMERISSPKLLVRVGRLRTDTKYFFKVYSPQDLDEISQAFQKDTQASKLIFKTSGDSDKEYSSAEWITDEEGRLTGIQLSVSAETYDTPTTCRIPLDINTCEKAGEVTYLSKSAFRLYKPASEYILPDNKRVGETLRETPLRDVRKFKAKTNGVPLMMLPEGDLVANSRGRFVRPDADKIQGTLTFYNRSTTASQEQVVLMSAKAEYRLVGDEDYQAVNVLEFDEGLTFPLTIEAGQTWRVPYTAVIPRNNKLKDLYLNIWGWALVALHRPLRLKLTFTDIEDRELTLVQEYIHKPRGLQEAKEEDLGFFFLDNLVAGSRNTVRISKPSSYDEQNIVSLNGTLYDADQLNTLVYRALHDGGKTEVEVHSREDNECHWKIYALIDSSCRRVYAFKVIMIQGPNAEKKDAGVIGYVPCPYYGGDDLEERPIKYATEEAFLPSDLEETEPMEVILDDTVDDDKPPVTPPAPPELVDVTQSPSGSPATPSTVEMEVLAPTASVATATSAAVSAALQEVSKVTANATSGGLDQTVFVNSMQSLERRLESLDTNVARMATALERLVEILGPNA